MSTCHHPKSMQHYVDALKVLPVSCEVIQYDSMEDDILSETETPNMIAHDLSDSILKR